MYEHVNTPFIKNFHFSAVSSVAITLNSGSTVYPEGTAALLLLYYRIVCVYSACVCPPRASGNSSPQQEVGVLFPADDALHLKRVGGGVAGGDHVTPQLPERPLANQLHSHWSDAAFDPERPVEGAVGLQTRVQLCA